jgi:hypothetical protein
MGMAHVLKQCLIAEVAQAVKRTLPGELQSSEPVLLVDYVLEVFTPEDGVRAPR